MSAELLHHVLGLDLQRRTSAHCCTPTTSGLPSSLCANEPRLRGPPDDQAVQFSTGAGGPVFTRRRHPPHANRSAPVVGDSYGRANDRHGLVPALVRLPTTCRVPTVRGTQTCPRIRWNGPGARHDLLRRSCRMEGNRLTAAMSATEPEVRDLDVIVDEVSAEAHLRREANREGMIGRQRADVLSAASAARYTSATKEGE